MITRIIPLLLVVSMVVSPLCAAPKLSIPKGLIKPSKTYANLNNVDWSDTFDSSSQSGASQASTEQLSEGSAFLACSALSLEAMNNERKISDPVAIPGAGRGRRQSGDSCSSSEQGSFARRFAALKALTDGRRPIVANHTLALSELVRQATHADLTKFDSSCSSSTYDGLDHGSKGKRAQARGQRPSWEESTTASNDVAHGAENGFHGNNGGRGVATRQSPEFLVGRESVVHVLRGFRPITPIFENTPSNEFGPVGPAPSGAQASALFPGAWIKFRSAEKAEIFPGVFDN